jgi:PilZ domain-containing protein
VRAVSALVGGPAFLSSFVSRTRSNSNWEILLVQTKHVRALRCPLVASVELTDLESTAQLKAETSDLSLFGCQVKTENLWTVGAKVRIRITRNGAGFAAFARIAYARPKAGMGIVFTRIEPIDQSVLDAWLANLRSR